MITLNDFVWFCIDNPIVGDYTYIITATNYNAYYL